MPQLTIELPDELSEWLTASGQDLSRAALEAIAIEAYRENKLSTGQMRRLLGCRTRMQVHELLKEHGVYLHLGCTQYRSLSSAVVSLPPHANSTGRC